MSYLYGREVVGGGLDDGVHGMSHGEGMCPVVVRHITVVLPYCEGEPDQAGHVKSAQPKSKS